MLWLLLPVIVLVATPTAAVEERRVVFDFPPAGQEGVAVAALAQGRLGFRADYVFDQQASMTKAERAANGTLHVSVQTRGLPDYEGWFVVAQESADFVHLRLADLPVGVETGVEGDALRVLAPPGKLFPLGSTDGARAEVWARALGIPRSEPSAWSASGPSLSAMYYFGPQVRAAGDAGDAPWFTTSCEECVMLSRWSNGTDGFTGRIEVGFAPDGSVVFLGATAWANLTASAVLSLEEAREKVRANLTGGGWDYTNLRFAYVTAAREQDRVFYAWDADVIIPGRPNARELTVHQDGFTGLVLEVGTPEAGGHPPEGLQGVLPVPASALGALAAIAAVAVLTRPRRA